MDVNWIIRIVILFNVEHVYIKLIFFDLVDHVLCREPVVSNMELQSYIDVIDAERCRRSVPKREEVTFEIRIWHEMFNK